VPGVGKVAQFLPDQAGYVMMQTVRVPSSSNFHRDYGPLGGLEILVAWNFASVLGGFLLLGRRDA
jgi:ABC-2 type transport system permease protein